MAPTSGAFRFQRKSIKARICSTYLAMRAFLLFIGFIGFGLF
jgi:hypothetical protein